MEGCQGRPDRQPGQRTATKVRRRHTTFATNACHATLTSSSTVARYNFKKIYHLTKIASDTNNLKTKKTKPKPS